MNSSLISVGVIFGGESREHEVSIKSALTVINALKHSSNSNLFTIHPIYIDLQGRWWGESLANQAITKICALKGNDLPKSIPSKGFNGFPQGSEHIDVWFPVLHGPNGEDGTIQGLLKLTGKPFVGSGVLGSALGMDKIAMKAIFNSAGFPQVKYLSVEAKDLASDSKLKDLISLIENKLSYPNFVKPANLGSSVGITKAKNQEELINGLLKASDFDNRIIIEEGLTARELECAALEDKEIIVSEVGEVNLQSDWYDYKAKYLQDTTTSIIPAEIPKTIKERVQDLTVRVCKEISVNGIARVDFFYVEESNEVLINEINTLPGFTDQSMYPNLWASSGLTLPKLVAHLIKTAQNK